MFFFNLVEDLLNYIEGLSRIVDIGIESEREWAFDLACQISSSKTLYVLIQHKWFLNLAMKLFNFFNGLWRSFNIGKEYESQWIFGLSYLRKI